MIKYFLNYFNTLLFFIFYLNIGNSQNKEDLGDWFFNQGDYFRAITVYRELEFYSNNPETLTKLKFKVGKAYFLSGKYEHSIKEFTSLLEYDINDFIRYHSLEFISLSFLKLSNINQAFFYANQSYTIDSVKSFLLLGLIYANMYDWKRSEEYYNKFITHSDNVKLIKLANDNINTIEQTKKIKYKKPIISLILSSFIPGAGQLYSEHYIDALQSFAFVSFFSYTSYLAYNYDKIKNNNFINFGLSLLITGIFHVANIIGAERSAVYYNYKVNQNILNNINETSLSIWR